MGSPCAPLRLSQFDHDIKGDAKLYFHYMDDIFRNIVENKLMNKVEEMNSYHKSLLFTLEREKEIKFPILNMKMEHRVGSRYCKPSDTMGFTHWQQ